MFNGEQIDRLAHRIAGRLFRNGNGDDGDRLAVKQRVEGEPGERDLGGWCYSAAVDQVRIVITGAVIRLLTEGPPGQDEGGEE